MRIRLKGINSKRKRLADGSLKTYYWAWKGGPPLRGEPGTPEFVASYNAGSRPKGRAAGRDVIGAAVSLSGERRISVWHLVAYPPRLHQADQAYRARLRRFSDQGVGCSGRAIDISRMARWAGANIIAPGRLCLWHAGAHSVLGATIAD